uniref:Uncharacterized protein n=1 Tax=Anguilla anguilla TaxID=7936 RepID=A0A0E9P9V6_ANGAN
MGFSQYYRRTCAWKMKVLLRCVCFPVPQRVQLQLKNKCFALDYCAF